MPDVQTAPARISVPAAGGPCDIKVDAACHRGGQVIVGGWCTSNVDVHLVVDQQPVPHRVFRFARQDVSTHYKLDYSDNAGFVLVADIAADAEIRLGWGAGGALALSKPLLLRPLAEATASDSHALGPVVEILGLVSEVAAARQSAPSTPGTSAGVGGDATQSIQTQDPQRRGGGPARRLIDVEPAAVHAVIVGAAGGVNTEKLTATEADVFGLNAAYFHLVSHGIQPRALVTGDRRFLVKQGIDSLADVRKLVTFEYALTADEVGRLGAETIIETFRCSGRDGFSSNPDAGFFHGCSSFFLAVQYLVSKGYKRISTLGVIFPPPELYSRVNGQLGHPEFVYGIQLANLAGLRKQLQKHCVTLRVMDENSNISLFV